MTTDQPLLLRNLRLPDGRRTDIFVRDGRIAEIEDGLSPPSGAELVDGDGRLVLSGLVDGHTHIDKTLFGLPWTPHPAGPDRESRIETEKRLRGDFSMSVEERAEALLRHMIACGTTALRTHVDIDPEIGLANLRAVLALRDRYREHVDMQIVAFPQSGIVRAPGTAELLNAAMRDGADLVGGIDPIAFEDDLDGHLDMVFSIAERHGRGIDLHIHDAGPTGIQELTAVAERTKAAGMQGKVTASHAFALGACDAATFDRVADAMATAGMSLATHGGGASPLPPVKRLREVGVPVFAGNDNIRDTWSPYGDGDMLERAMLTAWRSGFRTDEDLEIALDLATHAGATALGLEGYGLERGCRADFFLVDAVCPAQAVADRPVRSLVVKDGRIVAQDGDFTAS